MFLANFLPMKDMQDTSDDTLSLSDLPLYSNPGFEDDWFADSQAGSTSISSSENDYFEFFSQELPPPAAQTPPENIVFCGKVIPYKENNSIAKEVEIKKQTSIKKKSGWGWKFSSKNGAKSTTTSTQEEKYSRINVKEHDAFPIKKMLTSTKSDKARWHMLLFGISRISSGVELKDIRSRQSRRHSPPPSPLFSHRDEITGGKNGVGSSLWGLIRVLSCGGNQDLTNMVVGSITQTRLE